MKAILIDPKAKTIEEIDFKSGKEDYKEIKRVIETGRGFDVISFPNEDAMYVDDEFLIRREPPWEDDFFEIAGYDHPIAGKALILGTNEEGDSADVKLHIDVLRPLVTFKRKRYLGNKRTEGRGMILGKPGFIISNEAQFEDVT